MSACVAAAADANYHNVNGWEHEMDMKGKQKRRALNVSSIHKSFVGPELSF